MNWNICVSALHCEFSIPWDFLLFGFASSVANTVSPKCCDCVAKLGVFPTMTVAIMEMRASL